MPSPRKKLVFINSDSSYFKEGGKDLKGNVTNSTPWLSEADDFMERSHHPECRTKEGRWAWAVPTYVLYELTD